MVLPSQSRLRVTGLCARTGRRGRYIQHPCSLSATTHRPQNLRAQPGHLFTLCHFIASADSLENTQFQRASRVLLEHVFDPFEQPLVLGRSDLFPSKLSEPSQQCLFFATEICRDCDTDPDMQITAAEASQRRHTFAPQSEHSPRLGSGRNSHLGAALKRRNLKFCSECSLAELNRQLQKQVLAFAFEDIVLSDEHVDVNRQVGLPCSLPRLLRPLAALCRCQRLAAQSP